MKNTLLIHQYLDYTSKLYPGLDTCWMDRLWNWRFFYHISMIFNCSLVVQNYYWPEALFLDLPNTENTNSCDISFDKKNLLDIKNLSKILMKGFEHDKNLGNKSSYSSLNKFIKSYDSIFETTNFKYCIYDSLSLRNKVYFEIEKIFSTLPDYNIFKEIKFKNDEVNQFFIKKFSDICAIQIRRGVGTITNEKYLNDLCEYIDPTYVKLFYDKARLINNSPMYKIKTDDYYFKLIDDLIRIEPNKKIYLSYDVPKSFINHFLEKYPNNIVTKENYLQEYLSYFDEFELENDNYFLPLKKILVVLLDFFALAHSSIIVAENPNQKSLQSGWIHFSLNYKDKKVIYI